MDYSVRDVTRTEKNCKGENAEEKNNNEEGMGSQWDREWDWTSGARDKRHKKKMYYKGDSHRKTSFPMLVLAWILGSCFG